jgi:hypothetical protein
LRSNARDLGNIEFSAGDIALIEQLDLPPLLNYQVWHAASVAYGAAFFAIGGLIHFLGVVLLLDLFGDFGRSFTFLIVLSTLGIAALFTPLRLRVQDLIDRVFYRRKYDIARTLSRFSSFLRSELDVDALSLAVIDVVENTLHPEQTFIWSNTKPVGARFRPVQQAQSLTK